jgi:hypothetical protein
LKTPAVFVACPLRLPSFQGVVIVLMGAAGIVERREDTTVERGVTVKETDRYESQWQFNFPVISLILTDFRIS